MLVVILRLRPNQFKQLKNKHTGIHFNTHMNILIQSFHIVITVHFISTAIK